MTRSAQQRGGAPVGYLSELGKVETAAVIYLRLWNRKASELDPSGEDLLSALEMFESKQALQAFEQIFTLCARHGRRALMRHSLHCKCLGSDEACFANFIGAASEGNIEDAMLIATMIVRADMAPYLANLAETFGHSVKRSALGTTERVTSQPHSNTLH